MRKFWVILAFLLILVASCTKTESPQHVAADSTDYPDSRLDDAVIVFTQDGVQSVVIDAAHIDRWEKKDSTVADTVKVKFYDKEGDVTSSLVADRGLIHEKSEQISVFGHVVAVNEDSTVLKTESLFWDPQTSLITTDDYVEVYRAGGDVLTGNGLKADRQLHEIEILHNVKGKVIQLPAEDKENFQQDDSTGIGPTGQDIPETTGS